MDDDMLPEYDFPELHRRAKELGREYSGILKYLDEVRNGATIECNDPACPCYNNEDANHPPADDNKQEKPI